MTKVPRNNNIKVKAYTFDFDDNILHLTATARVYFKPQNDDQRSLIIKYITTYYPDVVKNGPFDERYHDFSDFIAYLPPKEIFTIKPSVFGLDQPQFNVVNVTSCCSDYAKMLDETRHTSPVYPEDIIIQKEGENHSTIFPRPSYCKYCCETCIGVVVTTAQYAELRGSAMFRKEDTYASFKLASSFLSATFEALSGPQITLPGSKSTHSDHNLFKYGFLPRNPIVLASLYQSYREAIELVEMMKKIEAKNPNCHSPKKHPDYIALVQRQQEERRKACCDDTIACLGFGADKVKCSKKNDSINSTKNDDSNITNPKGPNNNNNPLPQPPFRFLDLFSAYTSPTTFPKTKDEDQDTPLSLEEVEDSWREVEPEFIIANLAWMFTSPYSQPVFDAIKMGEIENGVNYGNNNTITNNTIITNPLQDQLNDSQKPLPSFPTSEPIKKHYPYGDFFPFPSFGPSLNRFLDSLLLHNFPIAIITSRGQPSWVLQRAIIAIILYLCTPEQLALMLKHIVYSAQLNCLCEYVSHIPVYAVHSPSFLNWVWSTEDLVKGGDDFGGLSLDPMDITAIKYEVLSVLKPPQPRSPEVYKCIAIASYLKRLVSSDYRQLAITGRVRHDPIPLSKQGGEVGNNNKKLDNEPNQPNQHNEHEYPLHHPDRIAGLDYTFTMGPVSHVPKQSVIYKRVQNRCYCGITRDLLTPLPSPNDGIDNNNKGVVQSCQTTLNNHNIKSIMVNNNNNDNINNSTNPSVTTPLAQKSNDSSILSLEFDVGESNSNIGAEDEPRSDPNSDPNMSEQITSQQQFDHKHPHFDSIPLPPATPLPDNGHVILKELPALSQVIFETKEQEDFIEKEKDQIINTINNNTITTTNTSITPSITINPGQQYLYSLGFSDDDKNNVVAMVDYFSKGLFKQYPQVKFVVYDTSDRGVLVKQVIDAERK